MMARIDSDILQQRRQRVADALGETPALVLVAAGAPITKPGGLDQQYPFLPHPAYYWLTGWRRSGGVLAYDVARGWTHFVRPVVDDERLWVGAREQLDDDAVDVAQLSNWVGDHTGRPIAVLGAEIPEMQGDPQTAAVLQVGLDAARRCKDSWELNVMGDAVRATVAGFERAREVIRPGATERDIQIELEAEMFRHGAAGVGYETIVGVGARAAILHSSPGPTVAESDDVVLIDAGGEIAGYTADVTRTFPVGKQFSSEQQAIYDIVLAAELAGIARCCAGVEWHDVHRAAAAELAAGLIDLGILRGTVDAALESEAIALFFPHGVGHMVGLGVRDVGGHAPDRKEGRKCCGAKVRVDLPIQAGFVMTVEPGIYFVPAILDDPERRKQFRDMVAWDQLDRWRAVGGVRIEDNVLVTEAEPEVLTCQIPK